MNQHLSEDEISQWVSGERLAGTAKHLRECPQCAAEVNATERTFTLFRESASEWSGACYGKEPAPRQPARLRAAALAACAAICTILCAILLYPVPPPREQAAGSPFLEFPYVAPLAPYERAEVVRMNVSVAELTAAGLEVRVPDTGATVLADVVLGQDGRAHAIRLVPSGNRSETP